MLVIFCAILVVSQLMRLSSVLVAFGISLENIFLPFLYLVLPFISIAIPMAFLFAVVLTFGRMSIDGEYPALLAAGYSLRRAAVPVMCVSVIAYACAAMSAMHLEAWGRRELLSFLYQKTQTELDHLLRYKLQSGVFLEDFVGYVIYAENVSADRTTLQNVLIAPNHSARKNSFTLFAPTGYISGSVEQGNLNMKLDYGVGYSSDPKSNSASVLKFNRAEIDLLKIFSSQILSDNDEHEDYRNLPPHQLTQLIKKLKADPKRNEDLYRKARYLFHQRLAMPAATFAFALIGMVLGITDPRKGKSWTYGSAILTVMAGYIFISIAKWFADNAYLSAPTAAWLPSILLTVIGGFLLYQKNHLPPSENPLALENLPFRKRKFADVDESQD